METTDRRVLDPTSMDAVPAGFTARERPRELLGALAREFGSNHEGWTRIAVPLEQWEMAHLIAVTPQYAWELIRAMAKDGLLRRERGGMLLSRSPDPVSGSLP